VDTCDGEWLSILTADGAQTLGLVDGCLPDCEDNCQPVACPLLCEPPMPFGASGGSTTWDGTFVEYLRCGASIACAHSACAPAGNYIARMCLYAAPPGSETTCQGLATTPTCTDVPFTWPPPPGASSVDGVISGAGPDSGAPD
jgi:hypothetical protein